MKFEMRTPFIIFHDNRPGQHATLFDQHGNKLPFRIDASSFNDKAKAYAWAFEFAGPLFSGDRIVFATTDREVVGIAGDSVIEFESESPAGKGIVIRDGEKPTELSHEKIAVYLASSPAPEVKAPPSIPTPPSKTGQKSRPTPMAKSETAPEPTPQPQRKRRR